MTITEIWEAIDKGHLVEWSNSLYFVHSIETGLNESTKLSYRNGEALRATCKSNGFGSVLHESDLSKCYLKQ